MANQLDMPVEFVDISQANTILPVRLVSAIVFLNGLFAILEVVYSRFSIRLAYLLPVDYEYYGRFFGLFAGFLLIYFSSQLLKRKQLAWWIAFVGSTLIVVDHGLFARNLTALLLPSTSLVLLAVYYDQFRVRSEPNSVKQGLKLLLLSISVALAYGTIGFTKLLPRDFTPHQNFTLWQGAVRTVREFTLIGNSDLVPRTHQAKWFLASLDSLGAFSIAIAFLSMFRPLAYRYRTLPQERRRARDVLEQYGTSSEDAFKLWPEDKSYYFLPGGEAFVAFRVARGVALVLGEPVGPIEQWGDLIAHFKQYCRVHDWLMAFIYVPKSHLKMLENAGLRPLKIGEDAVIEIDHFMMEVARNKHFRAVRNKFERLGYRFEVSEAPQTREVLSGAAVVTRSWLGNEGRSERGFGLGYHDTEYLRRSRLYLVYNEKNRLMAFANAVQSYSSKQETIDLMRQSNSAETGAMDFLILNVLEYLASTAVAEFSLGLAPMAGVGKGPERTLEERVIGYFGRIGIGGFSYSGLRRFKSKFEPRWEDRYFLCDRNPVALARAAAAISEVMSSR
jgi:phosphatidylglycerol lysyltransferase